MENKQAKPVDRQKGYSTFLGELFFLTFNLILLSLVSWIVLEAWFYIQMARDCHIEALVESVLNNDLMTIQSNHPFFFSKIVKSINEIQNLLTIECAKYVNQSIITLFFKILEITLSRFYLFILSIPLLLLIFCLSVIDGLVQRDIRKFQAARESTFLFHRLKPLTGMSFYLLFFVYITIPIAISPDIFLLAMAILSGLFTLLSIKSFKKYL